MIEKQPGLAGKQACLQSQVKLATWECLRGNSSIEGTINSLKGRMGNTAILTFNDMIGTAAGVHKEWACVTPFQTASRTTCGDAALPNALNLYSSTNVLISPQWVQEKLPNNLMSEARLLHTGDQTGTRGDTQHSATKDVRDPNLKISPVCGPVPYCVSCLAITTAVAFISAYNVKISEKIKGVNV